MRAAVLAMTAMTVVLAQAQSMPADVGPGRAAWFDISDEFAGGATLDRGFDEAILKTIDCYVMGSRT